MPPSKRKKKLSRREREIRYWFFQVVDLPPVLTDIIIQYLPFDFDRTQRELMRAAKHNRWRRVQDLLEDGSVPMTVNVHDKSAWDVASGKGCFNVLDVMLRLRLPECIKLLARNRWQLSLFSDDTSDEEDDDEVTQEDWNFVRWTDIYNNSRRKLIYIRRYLARQDWSHWNEFEQIPV